MSTTACALASLPGLRGVAPCPHCTDNNASFTLFYLPWPSPAESLLAHVPAPSFWEPECHCNPAGYESSCSCMGYPVPSRFMSPLL